MKKYLLVDSNALIHRAYHAYPTTLSLKDGTPTNAVYGFTALLITAIEKISPDIVICTFDTAKPTFRHEQFVDYKAHRKALDEGLKVQFPLVREIVEAFDLPIHSIEGYEADDLIGTLSRKIIEENADAEVIILTGDSDQYQLVNDRVHIFMAAKSFKDSVLLKYDDVVAKLGFEPKLLIDYKAIRGDTSDNIPGIKGIGEKVATDLVKEFGSVEDIYLNIENIKSKAVRQKLIDGYDMAILSQKLATIDLNAPVGIIDYEKGYVWDFEMEKINEIFSKFEFRSLRDRVAKLKVKYESSRDSNSTKSMFDDDGETIISSSKLKQKAPQKLEFLTPQIINSIQVGWNLKAYAKSIGERKILENKIHDLMVAEFALNMGSNPEIIQDDQLEKKYSTQVEELKKLPSIQKYLDTIEFPLIEVLYDMEMNGITVDSDAFDKLSEDLEIKIKEVSKNIYDFVGHEFNIGSPKQVGQVLSEELGIKLKKNKLGNYQTGEEELVKLIGAYDIAGYILKFREYSKLKNTYTNGLKKFIGDDGKIHTTYHQTIASTGRLSSKDPNLQNIPKGSEFADKIKSAFTTDAGFKLVSFDYSQQELRILAYLSKEENLLEAYRQGHDVHRQTASKIFSVGYDEVTKDQRNVAKTVNFGLVYGQGAFGLSEQLQKPVQECQGFIDKFFESFPKLKNYFDELLVEGQSKGYIETIMGRRRGTNGLKSPVAMLRNAARRELVNFPIQGSAADMTKLAMVNLAKMNFTNSDECKLLLQVHDELVFKVKDDENLPKVCEQIKQIMCEVIDLGIPIEVDFRISDSWGA